MAEMMESMDESLLEVSKVFRPFRVLTFLELVGSLAPGKSQGLLSERFSKADPLTFAMVLTAGVLRGGSGVSYLAFSLNRA